MGRLLVVATPIGNLDDLSPRAKDALASGLRRLLRGHAAHGKPLRAPRPDDAARLLPRPQRARARRRGPRAPRGGRDGRARLGRRDAARLGPGRAARRGRGRGRAPRRGDPGPVGRPRDPLACRASRPSRSRSSASRPRAAASATAGTPRTPARARDAPSSSSRRSASSSRSRRSRRRGATRPSPSAASSRSSTRRSCAGRASEVARTLAARPAVKGEIVIAAASAARVMVSVPDRRERLALGAAALAYAALLLWRFRTVPDGLVNDTAEEMLKGLALVEGRRLEVMTLDARLLGRDALALRHGPLRDAARPDRRRRGAPERRRRRAHGSGRGASSCASSSPRLPSRRDSCSRPGSPWLFHYGRSGLRVAAAAFFCALTGLLLTRACRAPERPRAFFVAGAVAALGAYVYTTCRALPIAVVAAVVWHTLRAAPENRSESRRAAGTAILGIFLFSLPNLAFLAKHPHEFLERGRYVYVGGAGDRAANVRATLALPFGFPDAYRGQAGTGAAFDADGVSATFSAAGLNPVPFWVTLLSGVGLMKILRMKWEGPEVFLLGMLALGSSRSRSGGTQPFKALHSPSHPPRARRTRDGPAHAARAVARHSAARPPPRWRLFDLLVFQGSLGTRSPAFRRTGRDRDRRARAERRRPGPGLVRRLARRERRSLPRARHAHGRRRVLRRAVRPAEGGAPAGRRHGPRRAESRLRRLDAGRVPGDPLSGTGAPSRARYSIEQSASARRGSATSFSSRSGQCTSGCAAKACR